MIETKRQAQMVHFRRRCRQRLGFKLEPEEIYSILNAIQAGGSLTVKLLERESNSRSAYLVSIRGYFCRIVYDHKRQTLVTVWLTDETGKVFAHNDGQRSGGLSRCNKCSNRLYCCECPVEALWSERKTETIKKEVKNG